MLSWHSRLFASPADLRKMTDLLQAARSPAHISAYPRPVDLAEMLQIPGIAARTCLWESSSDLLAYALVDLWNNLWFDLLPEFLGSPLEEQIVHWGAACLREPSAQEDSSGELTLDTNCYSDDSDRIALLQRQGFTQTPLQTVQLVRNLDRSIPVPRLPSGFFFRSVSCESEVDALVDLHRAAFGTDEMTPEYRLAMMQTPGYDPALDLLVVDPIGRLAAFCVCTLDPNSEGREGFTDPIGTHPAFRGKGLALAMLLEGMRRLKTRGVQTVHLDTTADNPAMLVAARSAGFRVEKTKFWFSKKL
jgi:ribosomal protein S18 acetylase RimI-like enzyme